MLSQKLGRTSVINALPHMSMSEQRSVNSTPSAPVFAVDNVVFHNLSRVFDADKCTRGLVRFCVFTDRPVVPNLCDTDPGW